MIVGYYDNDCNPRVGVRPESISVVLVSTTGGLKVNDLAANTYADDSTDAGGAARITIPSFSGCGTARFRLYVSGLNQGIKTVVVRTTDTNADGRTTTADQVSPCDVTYNTTASDDAGVVSAHVDHSNRNALHGTLVRRTNLCETCDEEEVNVKGEGQVFWSPSGRFISYTAFIDASASCPPVGGEPATSCKVFIVPSNPTEGNARIQLTSEPICYHDYDPSWSPLNDAIVFDRGDSVIISKPLPWTGSSTETVITASNNFNCGALHGDDIPAVSPDGRWVAFSRCNPRPPMGPGGWSIWKIPVTGGMATRRTAVSGDTDYYASWSPDGLTIYFQRQGTTAPGQISAWKVPASGTGAAIQVYAPPSSPDLVDAVQPGSSPDGAMLIMGQGKRDFLARNVVAHTLDATIITPTSDKVVANYPDTIFAVKGDFPILSPRVSYDGTRLALGSKQVWAVRRNMNLPPAFTSVNSSNEGTRTVADTAATVLFTFGVFETSFITVTASDPEGDVLSYRTSFLQSWMSWDPATRTLSGTPPSGTMGYFYVKFWVTTLSGGTDSFVAVINVTITLPFARSRLEPATAREGPNPTRATFAVSVPTIRGATARLSVYDLSGRLVAVVQGPAFDQLVWEGRDRSGTLVPAGVYLWRLDTRNHRKEGRVVVIR